MSTNRHAAMSALFAALLALTLCACAGQSQSIAPAPAHGNAPPAELLASLPPLPALDAATNSPGRRVSTSDQEFGGDQLFSHNSAVTLDTNNHTSSFAPAAGQLAFGIMEFDATNDDRVASVGGDVSNLSGDGNVWVAISDYAHQAWKYLPVQNGSFNVDLGGVSGTYSNGSKLYVAVLGWKSQFNLLLARLGFASGFYPGWVHHWGDSGVDTGSRMAIDANGNLLFAGGYYAYDLTASDYTRTALLQLSPGGNLLAARTYQIFDDTSMTESLIFSDMLRKDDGTIYLIARTSGTAAGEDGVIIKLDSALNILWSKSYDTGADDDLNCAALKANGDLVCAGETLYANDNFHQDAWLITVNGATGDLLSSTVFEIADTSEVVRYIDLDEAGGKVLLAGDMDGDSLLGDAFLMSEPLSGGAPNWARQYGGPDSDYCSGICRAGNGSAVAAVNFETANDSVLLTIESDGSLSLESGFVDSDGTLGLSVWRMVYNQASGGPLMAGARLDDMGNPVGGVTSLITFNGDLAPLSGSTYGWYFVDWRFTPQSLYTNSFVGTGAALLPTLTAVHDGSLSGKAGSGSFSSLSASATTPSGGGSATASVTATDTPNRFDGQYTDDSDQDMLMVRFDPPAP